MGRRMNIPERPSLRREVGAKFLLLSPFVLADLYWTCVVALFLPLPSIPSSNKNLNSRSRRRRRRLRWSDQLRTTGWSPPTCLQPCSHACLVRSARRIRNSFSKEILRVNLKRLTEAEGETIWKLSNGPAAEATSHNQSLNFL